MMCVDLVWGGSLAVLDSARRMTHRATMKCASILAAVVLVAALPVAAAEPVASVASTPVESTPVASTMGWKSALGIPVAVIGGLVALGGTASLMAGAVVLTSPGDPNASLGFPLFGAGLGALPLGALIGVGGGALVVNDLNDGE